MNSAMSCFNFNLLLSCPLIDMTEACFQVAIHLVPGQICAKNCVHLCIIDVVIVEQFAASENVIKKTSKHTA